MFLEVSFNQFGERLSSKASQNNTRAWTQTGLIEKSGRFRVTSQHKATKKNIFENLCERPIEIYSCQI